MYVYMYDSIQKRRRSRYAMLFTGRAKRLYCSRVSPIRVRLLFAFVHTWPELVGGGGEGGTACSAILCHHIVLFASSPRPSSPSLKAWLSLIGYFRVIVVECSRLNNGLQCLGYKYHRISVKYCNVNYGTSTLLANIKSLGNALIRWR